MGAQSLVFSLERAGEHGGAQAGALDGGSFPSSHATEEGEIQPYSTSAQPHTQERGGETLSAPSRQLARALEACDLIKIIVLMQNHKCQEDTEGCAWLFTAPSPDSQGLQGKHHSLAARALHVPGSGIFSRNLAFVV